MLTFLFRVKWSSVYWVIFRSWPSLSNVWLISLMRPEGESDSCCYGTNRHKPSVPTPYEPVNHTAAPWSFRQSASVKISKRSFKTYCDWSVVLIGFSMMYLIILVYFFSQSHNRTNRAHQSQNYCHGQSNQRNRLWIPVWRYSCLMVAKYLIFDDYFTIEMLKNQQ